MFIYIPNFIENFKQKNKTNLNRRIRLIRTKIQKNKTGKMKEEKQKKSAKRKRIAVKYK